MKYLLLIAALTAAIGTAPATRLAAGDCCNGKKCCGTECCKKQQLDYKRSPRRRDPARAFVCFFLAASFLIANASPQTRVVAGRARLTRNGCACFFDNKWDQRERSHAIKPPPSQPPSGG